LNRMGIGGVGDNMKSIVFDTGPVISLTTNNLLWALDHLKDEFEGDFYITPAVKNELVDRPLRSKKFKFEALQVGYRIRKGILNVLDIPKVTLLAEELRELANHTFKTKGNWLHIVQNAEMEAIAAAIVLNSSAVVVDERTTKLLVEDQKELARVLHSKLHTKVFVNQKNLDKIRNWVKGVKILRSVELVMVAYEKGIFDKYLAKDLGSRKTLIESLLWGVKLHGCALSRREIDEIVAIELGGEQTTVKQQ